MIIVCSKDILQKCINIAMRAIPIRTTMPILECILLDASGSQIHFVANDMELGVDTIVEGNILEHGIVALDAKILDQIVRKLPDGQVTIKTDEENVAYITCGKAKFNIPGKPGDTFIFLPSVEKKVGLTLSQFVLKEMIRQTIFSVANNENNPMMLGELFEIQGGNLRIASLDGHRIAIRNLHLEKDYEDLKVIIPAKALTELSKILSGELADTVTLYFETNRFLVEMNQTIMVSRLIEGDYYRIDQMTPKDYETKIYINKKEFLECIDRSVLLVKEGDKKPLVIEVFEDYIDIQMKSVLGSMNEQIDIRKEGRDIRIAFNPRFLIDALRAINEEEITIYFTSPKAPCVIQDDKRSYVYLILPVNINQDSSY